MATTPFTVEAIVERNSFGGDWEYVISINSKRLMTGERRTRNGAARAARSQLKQLIKNIEQQLQNLP